MKVPHDFICKEMLLREETPIFYFQVVDMERNVIKCFLLLLLLKLVCKTLLQTTSKKTQFIRKYKHSLYKGHVKKQGFRGKNM